MNLHRNIAVVIARQFQCSRLLALRLTLAFPFILFFLFPDFLLSQEHLFDARRITPEEGLANLLTTSVYKDSRGFLWVGTRYGLNRYDAYNFKLYDKEKNALHSNENIRQISEDPHGNLWLFHRGDAYAPIEPGSEIYALDIFSPKTEQSVSFEDYFANKTSFKASDIYLPKINDYQNRQWLCTNRGEVFLYDGAFKKIFQKEGAFFRSLTVDQNDFVWLSFEDQLIGVDQSEKVLEQLSAPDYIYKTWIGNTGDFWLATRNPYGGEVAVYRKAANNSLIPFTFSRNGKPLKISMEGVGYVLHFNQQGYWFVSIEKEIHVFNRKGEWLFNYAELLGENSKVEISNYFESGSDMWLTSSLGLIKLSAAVNPFQIIHQKTDRTSDCRGITEDEAGNIYFLNTYLYQWNKKDQSLTKLSELQGANGLTYTNRTLFAGDYTTKSLGFQIDIEANRELRYPVLEPANHLAFAFMKTNNPKRFLVGQNKGLAWLDLEKQKIIPFDKYGLNSDRDDLLKNSEVNFMHKNASGIWLATSNGIFLLTENDGVLQHYTAEGGDLPFDHIRHIHEDAQGIFWLATKGGGLIQWRPAISKTKTSAYKQFTISQGLSNNYTYAVYEDDYEMLWIPSDLGLMRMDKKTARVRTFTTDDGLPHNEFNHTAHYQAQDGGLYFGGLGGLITFHPKTFANHFTNKSPLVFTGYYLLEEGMEEMTNKTRLLEASEEIAIKPSDKFFELRFSLMDYKNPEQHHYAYQIEGYSNNWNYTDDNFIRITNLPYGNYTLKIQGQSGSRGWSEQELSLAIRVLKPFYLQWWFILTGLISSVGLIAALTRRRIVALKRDQERLETEVRKRTWQLEEKNRRIEADKQIITAQAESLQKLDKAKTRFFSNITHEFRTPLTLIIGPLEQAFSEELSLGLFRKRMRGVLKNARHILNLVNQLLDLSKIESGRMKVEAARGDIIAYTQELTKRFEPLAHKKGQLLRFVSNQDSWETQFDKDKWDKIVYNLLSNAIKFTPPGENIQLSVLKIQEEAKEWIRLDIRDTGVGIKKEQLGSIFNRFYQVDDSTTRAQGGTGVGLALVKELIELQGGQIQVLSEIDKGTSFEVRLPVLQAEAVKPLPDLLAQEILSVWETADESPALKNGQSALSKTEKLDLLIVEDNEEIRDYIRYCLDEARYNIIEANDGEEGLQKAQALIPDLIISDVMMPKKDGFALAQAIRSDLRTSHIPLILLTAKASLESKLEGIGRGADAYLTKPFSPRELSLRIEKLIEIRRLLQQRYQGQAPSAKDETYEQEDEFITNLREYILQRLDETNLNGERIGRHFGMSRSHLHRKLKALTNHSVRDFVKSMRLEKALELIREGKSNVSEIAWQTGFSSVSHFSRSFKKVYGKAPSEM